MIAYGDAIDWCIRNGAVWRFVKRDVRPEFVYVNRDTPGTIAIELAYTAEDGKPKAVHAPLDTSSEPSKAVALALICCVQFFMKREGQVLSAVM
jgi:hypothetical protein